MSETKRGRPLGPIQRPHRRPGWYGCEDRIAWLLRVNRLHARDGRLARVGGFAAAFPGGSWHGPVSASQISRWETAHARAGYGVLRRYEELLELSPNHLVAVADWVYRKASDPAGPPVLDRGLNPEDPLVHRRTEQLLERALSTDLMSAADWDELTSHLAALPAAFLFPPTAWADLAERLLQELLLGDGPAWLSRIEALARLMAHPRTRAAIIAACGSLAADPNNQVVIEPLTILDMTADQDANRYVLSQLTHPAGDRALRGALLSSIEKIRHRHFPAGQLRTIAITAADLLTEAELDVEARQLAAALLRRAPAGHTGPTRFLLRRNVDATSRAILNHGQTATPDASEHVVARVLAATLNQMPRSAQADTDPMLARLLGDLLFSPSQNERLLARLLIAATPYREAVGAALAAELATGSAAHTVSLTTATLAALPLVGRPADRLVVERNILAPGLATPITDAAAWAIGHVPGTSDARFWLTAIDTHRHAWQRSRNPASLSILRGLVYALGIKRRDALLHTVRADTRLPAPTRTAATWWLNIPAYLHASAAS